MKDGVEPDETNVWGTCHTVDCVNYEIAIFIEALYGELWCGGCDQPITDVAKQPPEPVTEMPTWEL